MTIASERTGKTTVTLVLNGRLDTANAPLLEQKIKQWGTDITELILDFKALDYISSMGLRVLLQAKKELKKDNRKLTIKNMGDSVKEVFEMTGFLNLMVQEEKFVVIRKNDGDSITISINGEMQHENVAVVAKELAEIKESNAREGKPVTVFLDMEKLAITSHEAIKLLKEAIKETAWEKRKLHIKNPGATLKIILEDQGLEYLENEQ